MEHISPSVTEIAKLVKAVKHCQKVIDTVEKKGIYIERIGNTGVEIEITQESVVYLTYKSRLASYQEQLAAYEITRRAPAAVQLTIERTGSVTE